jgi:hypothetical protein
MLRSKRTVRLSTISLECPTYEIEDAAMRLLSAHYQAARVDLVWAHRRRYHRLQRQLRPPRQELSAWMARVDTIKPSRVKAQLLVVVVLPRDTGKLAEIHR